VSFRKAAPDPRASTRCEPDTIRRRGRPGSESVRFSPSPPAQQGQHPARPPAAPAPRASESLSIPARAGPGPSELPYTSVRRQGPGASARCSGPAHWHPSPSRASVRGRYGTRPPGPGATRVSPPAPRPAGTPGPESAPLRAVTVRVCRSGTQAAAWQRRHRVVVTRTRTAARAAGRPALRASFRRRAPPGLLLAGRPGPRASAGVFAGASAGPGTAASAGPAHGPPPRPARLRRVSALPSSGSVRRRVRWPGRGAGTTPPARQPHCLRPAALRLWHARPAGRPARAGLST
jgi:translation initiation factor IF-2